MAKCYQHDHQGFYVCETDDCGGFLPAGAVYDAPVLQEGFIPKWDGQKWKQIETHKGEEGFVNGVAITIKTHGAYPDGWSDTPPPLTLFEALTKAYEQIKSARDARMNNGGLVWGGYLVSIDKEATDRMTSKAVEFMAGACVATNWKMSDGEYAVLDQTAFFAMSMAVGGAVAGCYLAEEIKRKAVEALGSADAVLAWLDDPSNLQDGWPADGAE